MLGAVSKYQREVAGTQSRMRPGRCRSERSGQEGKKPRGTRLLHDTLSTSQMAPALLNSPLSPRPQEVSSHPLYKRLQRGVGEPAARSHPGP